MIPSVRTGAVAVLVCALVAGACGGKKPPAAAPAPPPVAPPAATTPPTPPPPVPPPPPTPTVEKPPTEDELFARTTLADLTTSGVLKPVFFGFDSTTLADDARAILQTNVEYLKKRPSTKVMVEGHADSRGTNEYNLALSGKRASVVRDYLVSLGVGGDRLSAVGKGEEQPFCREETEACWQENRVGFFVFTAK